jgi:hypothetical protein
MSGTTTYFGITYPTSTDLVKDGASNMQTIATGFDSAVAIPTYNAQTGTSYTFALTDIGKTVTASNASASTYTIPPQASVVWPTNATLDVVNLGAGVVTFAAGAGVTVTNATATLSQYARASLVRTGLNAWTVVTADGSSGLTLIKTQTIGTAVTSVAVTNAYSATYDHYKIIVSGGVASTGSDLSIINTGSTASYQYIQFYQFYTSGAQTNAFSASASSFTPVGSGTTSTLMVSVEVKNPFLAVPTFFSAPQLLGNAAGMANGVHGLSTSYTGFTIAAGSGTMTGGTIAVYGYNK